MTPTSRIKQQQQLTGHKKERMYWEEANTPGRTFLRSIYINITNYSYIYEAEELQRWGRYVSKNERCYILITIYIYIYCNKYKCVSSVIVTNEINIQLIFE